MQWGQMMKREKSYRKKSKNKIHFKVCNQTITELCPDIQQFVIY